ncbi:MFS transporter [Mycoplasmatota bacterium WC30]
MDNSIAPRQNVFKNKNFALLFGGVLVSNIAHIMFNFVMSLYVLRIATEAFGEDLAPMYQGYYLALAGIVLVVLMPFGGALADRLNKVRTMYITDFIRGATILGVAYLVFSSSDPSQKLIYLFIMNAILGINSAFFNPASSSLLRFIVKEEEIHQASSYLHGSYALQNIAGLVLGGILFSLFSVYVIFLINGIAYLLSGVTELFIKYNAKEHVQKTKLDSVFKDIKSGIKYLFNYKAMFSLLLMALFLNFFSVPLFQNAIPYFIEFGLGKEVTFLFDGFMTVENWFSVIMLASSVSGIIMSLILSRRRPKESYAKDLRVALIAFSVFGLFIGGYMSLYHLGYLGVNYILILLPVTMFLIGFASVGFNVPVSITFQKKIEKSQLGKVTSLSSVLSQALVPISALVAGLLISKISIIAVYAFCGIGMTAVVILYLSNKNSGAI